MDPLSLLSLIGSSLGLVDQFTNIVAKRKGEEKSEHRVQTRQDGEYLEIKDGDQVDRIHASQLNILEWNSDELRYETLWDKVKVNFKMFNDIDKQLPLSAVDEKIRLLQKMESIRADLCKDFEELIWIHEKMLGYPLGDHYSLYDTCQGKLNDA